MKSNVLLVVVINLIINRTLVDHIDIHHINMVMSLIRDHYSMMGNSASNLITRDKECKVNETMDGNIVDEEMVQLIIIDLMLTPQCTIEKKKAIPTKNMIVIIKLKGVIKIVYLTDVDMTRHTVIVVITITIKRIIDIPTLIKTIDTRMSYAMAMNPTVLL